MAIVDKKKIPPKSNAQLQNI